MSGMVTGAGGFVLLSSLLVAEAPIQCTHDADPSLRTEDTAGDGLWDLAASFEKEGNHASAVETWRYLADKYPSNRHAFEARHLASASAAAGAEKAP